MLSNELLLCYNADTAEADRETADQFRRSDCSRNGIPVQPQVCPSRPGSKELHVSCFTMH